MSVKYKTHARGLTDFFVLNKRYCGRLLCELVTLELWIASPKDVCCPTEDGLWQRIYVMSNTKDIYRKRTATHQKKALKQHTFRFRTVLNLKQNNNNKIQTNWIARSSCCCIHVYLCVVLLNDIPILYSCNNGRHLYDASVNIL